LQRLSHNYGPQYVARKPQPDPRYTSNAEETDTRIWVHVRQTECAKIPPPQDTDVYHIGLPLVTQSAKDIVVQISPINSRDRKFVSLSALHTALRQDPDLAGLESTKLAHILQTIYVCTGCDYISFFSGNVPFSAICFNMPHSLLELMLKGHWQILSYTQITTNWHF
jgi:hypothetical protein